MRSFKRALVTAALLTVNTARALQQPWPRGPTSYRYHHSRTSRFRKYALPPEASSHVLGDPNWMTDKKTRLWSGQKQTRAPNTYSWTYRLVAANVVVFAAQLYNPMVTAWGVKISDRILKGEELYRLVSPIFLHGSTVHIFANMYSLNNVGPIAERVFGAGRFLATFLVAGVVGNYLSALRSPRLALGASGAVSGIVASIYVFANRNNWYLGDSAKGISRSIMNSVLVNVFLGMSSGVDNWGHLGGAIGGAAMAYYFGPRLYLAELPGGGKVVVDRPILRLPRPIESVPDRLSSGVRRMAHRLTLGN